MRFYRILGVCLLGLLGSVFSPSCPIGVDTTEGGIWGGEGSFGVGRDRWKTLAAPGALLCTKGVPYAGVDPPDSSWPGQTRPVRTKACGLVRLMHRERRAVQIGKV